MTYTSHFDPINNKTIEHINSIEGDFIAIEQIKYCQALSIGMVKLLLNLRTDIIKDPKDILFDINSYVILLKEDLIKDLIP